MRHKLHHFAAVFTTVNRLERVTQINVKYTCARGPMGLFSFYLLTAVFYLPAGHPSHARRKKEDYTLIMPSY